MMICYFKTRKIKYFFDPPPPKKRLKDRNGSNMSTRTGVCQYQQPFIENYYLIIVVFTGPHFSLYDIF